MIANRERGELVWRVDDRPVLWRLEVWACIALEQHSGHLFQAVIGQVNKDRMQALRWLVWAVLQAQHAGEVPSPEAAGLLIDQAGGAAGVLPVVQEFLRINGDDREPAPAPKKGQRVFKRKDPPGSLWRRLYIEARILGMAPEVFWRLSLRELWLELAAIDEAAKRNRERDLTWAWHAARLVWEKTPTPLEKLIGLEAEEGAQQQSWQEMKAMLIAMTGATPKQKH